MREAEKVRDGFAFPIPIFLFYQSRTYFRPVALSHRGITPMGEEIGEREKAVGRVGGDAGNGWIMKANVPP